MSEQAYQGKELEVFRNARNWESYLSAMILPFMTGDVLEVGAGIGSHTRTFCNGAQKSWLCIEPDRAQSAIIEQSVQSGEIPSYCKVKTGVLGDLDAGSSFDVIVYLDVLEHIEDDRAEIELAVSHLRPGGRLIVQVPAFQWLFSPFDAEIGHFRRYNRPHLKSVIPRAMSCEKLHYLDSLSLLILIGNRMLVRKKTPGKKDIELWDRVFIPLSKLCDRLTGYSFGRCLLGIWKK